MKIVLSDNGLHKRFAPLTLTRPLGELRMGAMTNAERWRLIVPEAAIYFETEEYLVSKFNQTSDFDLRVNAQLIPNEEVAVSILNLGEDEKLVYNGTWLAQKGGGTGLVHFTGESPLLISQRWQLYQCNDQAISIDFNWLTTDRISCNLSSSNTLIGDENRLFIEEGAKIEGAILNTSEGPIYVAKNAEIMEGSLVRGPFILGENSQLKMGAKIYGATTIGPHCKVGGEVTNVVFQAYSNKGHDGFLGNSLIGEWCNIGADSNTSNLKNNYGPVSTYSYEEGCEITTDVLFMGLTMGDHSKCGINTMFNTASVVGVSSNIFGAGFPKKFIPSFQWGGEETIPFRLEKAIEYSNNMMRRRGCQLSEDEKLILQYLSKQE